MQSTFVNTGDSIMIALSLSLLTMLVTIVVHAKYSREKFLNKLTLLPFYTSMTFLVLFLIQIGLLNMTSDFPDENLWKLVLQIDTSAKAVLCSYTAFV